MYNKNALLRFESTYDRAHTELLKWVNWSVWGGLASVLCIRHKPTSHTCISINSYGTLATDQAVLSALGDKDAPAPELVVLPFN